MAQPREIKPRILRVNGTPRNTTSQPIQEQDSIIEQNLLPLKQNNKKKYAQKLYYQNHANFQSPLSREKAPVRQRLGIKQLRLRRLVPLGTSTSSLMPKKKIVQQQNNSKIQNTLNQFRQNKLQRAYSAQNRLERIRAQQQLGAPIKLRRINVAMSSAANLRVQVRNPDFQSQSAVPGMYKFKMELDPKIQAEILDIQSENAAPPVPIPPSTRFAPVTTNVSLSVRFGLL